MAKQSDSSNILSDLQRQLEEWEKEGYDVSDLKLALLSVDSRSSAKSAKPSRKLWLYILIPVIIVVVIAVVVVVVVMLSGSSTNTSGECAPGCQWAWVGDGTCDQTLGCNVYACDYDGGDCSGYCATGCQWAWVGDGTCDEALGCNVYACNYDGGDCQ
ncbi:MAG: LNR domain-containing protein [Dehalococcoidia bacterium]